MICHITVFLELSPEGKTYIGRHKSRRRDLIEKRRETMEVISVDKTYLIFVGIKPLA
jgi:hypothetical protein